ncbi:helix-turn-helix transcriptional regulator [Bradyrhizobium sp. C9]|uniref:TetR/AcrR family transcriptional regulator n=1 Tax=Bradyrhizobium sp. C9 TaxID=142585 RepID=UPI00117734A9|nr:helix-turn-helix transcriptional regulator [Bradyrhizobium sp. C9]
MGRPPTDLAAEVDLRILTAACEWFLARELAGVSVEEIACRASKATVYTRFPDQRGAGCRDHPAQLGNSAERIGKAPSSGMLEERLTVLETEILKHIPIADFIYGSHRSAPLSRSGESRRMMRKRGTHNAPAS